MTLWSDFERSAPRVASTAQLAYRLYLRPSFPDTTFYVQQGLTPAVAEIAGDPSTVAGGVYGGGAWLDDFGGVRPALFVQVGMAPPGGTTLDRSELRALVPNGGLAALSDVVVIPLAQPSPYATPPLTGDDITIGSRRATAGIWARCRTTKAIGFLTAGHAAPTVGQIVRDARGVAVGSVLRTVPTNVSGVAATGDVAFIEAQTNMLPVQQPPGLPVRSVAPRDQVSVQLKRGAASTWIRGLSFSFAVSPEQPPWGEVGITASAVSVGGDSGAPVVSDGSIVAHVVGGAPHDYSVVQDVLYQLDEIDADAI